MDVLICLNFVVTYLLLLCTLRIAGARLLRGRLLVAASLGGVFSLMIFLPPLPGAVNALLKLVSTGVLLLVAAGFGSIGRYCWRLFLLFCTSFLFAGLMLFMNLLPGSQRAFFYNGVIYYQISAVWLLGLSALSWVAITLWERFFRANTVGGIRYEAALVTPLGSCKIMAMVDSQNNLTDLFTGAPVAVVPLELVRGVAPAAVLQAAEGLSRGELPQSGVRLIPCSTVSGEGMLPAFFPEEMVLEDDKGGKTVVENPCVAVSSTLSCGWLLLSPLMIGFPTKQTIKKAVRGNHVHSNTDTQATEGTGAAASPDGANQ